MKSYHFKLYILSKYIRGLPADRNKDQFINRKGWYSLNVLVTGGPDKKIYDLVVNAPGSFHDAAIWAMSAVKPFLERRFPREHCLADSSMTYFLLIKISLDFFSLSSF